MTITLENMEFSAVTLPTANSVILLIQGQKANLGCGYFSMAAAEKMGDRFLKVKFVLERQGRKKSFERIYHCFNGSVAYE